MEFSVFYILKKLIICYLQADGNTHEEGYDPKYHSFTDLLFKTKSTKRWDPVS